MPPTPTNDRLEGMIESMGDAVAFVEIMAHDPDLDPLAADIVRFYLARLRRRQRQLWLQADIAMITAEMAEVPDHEPQL